MFKVISKLMVVLCFMSLSSLSSFAQCNDDDDDDDNYGGSNSSLATACPGYRTFTQSKWSSSSNPNSSSSAAYWLTTSNFNTLFPAPTALTIGSNNRFLKLTTTNAVRRFLPQEENISTLPTGTRTNPGSNGSNEYNNLFAGNLVALTLNVKFDDYYANFAAPAGKLKNLVIATGPFVGWTVQQLLDRANLKIGGASTAPYTFTSSQYNTAIQNVLATYSNGNTSGGFLACPLEATASATVVSCYGGSNGTINVTASLGIAPYTYTFPGSAPSPFNSKSGFAAGTYTVSVRDQIGQQVTLTVTVTENTQVVATSDHTDNVCNSANGSATGVASVTAEGGVGPYSYSWGTAGSGSSIDELPAGTYGYTVTDALNCTASGSVEITEPTAMSGSISLNSPIICNSDCNGKLSVDNAAGGTAPYSYEWSNQAIGKLATGLCSGNYSVTVTDANGCTLEIEAYELVDPAVLTISVSGTDITCHDDNDGTAASDVDGGLSPYTITWSNTVVATEISGLYAGIYSASVVDALGCPKTSTNVTVVNPAPLTISVSGTDITCHDANDGTATATVEGAQGATTITGGSTAATSLSNLSAGTYSASVVDAKGCEATSNEVTVVNPAPLTISVSGTDITCHDANDGTATATVEGAQGATTITWGSTVATSLSNLSAGTYSASVVDAKGCEASSDEVEVTNPAAMAISDVVLTPTSDCNSNTLNGSASFVITNASGAYTITGYTGSNLTSLSNLSSGALSIVVTDENSCQATFDLGTVGCTESLICGRGRTYTQNQWGVNPNFNANPNGQNAGVLLHNSFSTVFPAGVTIGCPGNLYTYTTAQSLTDALPISGSPAVLPAQSQFRGNLLATMLNVAFDAANESFSVSGVNIGDMYVNAEGLVNMTVNEIVALANNKIGGCSVSSGYANVSLSTINNALTLINNNFKDGESEDKLSCEPFSNGNNDDDDRNLFVSGTQSDEFHTTVYPNPCIDGFASLVINATEEESVWINIHSAVGQLISSQRFMTTSGTNLVTLDLARVAKQTCIVSIVRNDKVYNHLLIVE